MLSLREFKFGRTIGATEIASESEMLSGVVTEDFGWELQDDAYLLSTTKRVIDVFGAIIAIVGLAPILIVIAALVVCTSSGPVIFRQPRYGRGMREFEIFKFRTMYFTSPDEPFVQASRRDSRITGFGRFLRATSLDELPQLLNVLRGDMSLVGPRPHPIALDQKFVPEIPRYETRFRALPGITGLAQVSGARGETPTVDHMRRRVEFDATYISTASLKLDCAILFRTVFELVGSRAAF